MTNSSQVLLFQAERGSEKSRIQSKRFQSGRSFRAVSTRGHDAIRRYWPVYKQAKQEGKRTKMVVINCTLMEPGD